MHNADRCVLVVGESQDMLYARELANEHSDWIVVGSNYGLGGSSQIELPSNVDNLRLLTNVDARALDTGSITSQIEFSDVVFNAPRSHTGWRKETGDLIDAVLASSRNILTPSGRVRFSGSGGMPGAPRLRQRLRDLFPGYVHAQGGTTVSRGIPFLQDTESGMPRYQPTNNAGGDLRISLDNIYWYIFTAR